jgi:hypothetical protein
MKLSVTALTILLLGSCSSGDTVSILKPEITFVQLRGPVEQNYPQGDFEVQYGVRIANRSSEPIILRQIELQPMSAGGPYVVKAESYHFEKEIRPAATEDILFWAKVTSTGDQFSDDARAPVNIRATAHFDAQSGAFRQVFTKVLSQTGGRLGNR